jgi:hypothetical protein
MLRSAVWLTLAALAVPALAAQTRGPLPTSPPSGPVVLPGTPKTVPPPPVPADEIIQRFTQNEDAMMRARSGFTYRRTVRVQEFDDKGQPSGEFQVVSESYLGPDGKLYEKVVQHPPSTLMALNFVEEDTGMLNRIPLFPLTSAQAAKYDITYTGTQKLDELNTYIFQVKPKQVERTVALFDGVVWVDTGDFAIVKTTGKWITELGEVSTPQFPFTVFDTLRENVARKQWYPAYIRSDAYIPTKNASVHVRLVELWQDYKPAAAAASEK